MSALTDAIVITACGKRKSAEPNLALRAGTLPTGDPSVVAECWATRVAVSPNRLPARELYQGRAFREAELAAAAGGKMYVLSAGIGLVPVEVEIPAYSLTVAEGPDNVLARLTPIERAQPSVWWRELTRICGAPSFRDIVSAGSGPVLIAAGTSYLAMVAGDLAALDDHGRSRLRIFTAAAPSALPASLRVMVMPYDRRLEGIAGRAGTLSDFAQRALRHFAETVLPALPGGSPKEHAASVLSELKGVHAPIRRRGVSVSDAEIIALICDNWTRTSGKSAVTLRLLRDSFGVACEQSRFRKLFAVARSELSS